MTVMNTELPLRPRPENGETLLGYLLRVSHVNGYRQEQTIRKLFGLKSTPFHYVTSSYRGFDALVEMMSMRLRISSEALIEHFQHELDGAYDDNRAVQDISITEPKVCLACMREERSMSTKWRLAHVTHCELHHTPLLMQCPVCHTTMKWKPTLYSCCDQCGVEWKDIEVKSEDLPLYQSTEHSLDHGQLLTYRRNLYKMVRLSLRFYDMQRGEFRVFPSDVDDIHALFNFSYRLLVDKAFRKQQLQNRVNFWQENAKLRYIPNEFFGALHEDYQQGMTFPDNITDYQVQPFHVVQFQSNRISNPRVSLVKNSFDAHVQLDLNTLAHCSGLTTADISSAVKQKLLTPRNETLLPRDFWFNVQDVDKLYGQFYEKSQLIRNCKSPHNLLSLRQAISILRRFKWTVADILKLILEDRCESFVETKNQPIELLSLNVNREQLFSEMGRLFTTDQSEISERNVARFFFIPPDYLSEFLSFLQKTGAEQTIECCLYHFIESYLVLNQWCRLRKSSIPKARNHLLDEGFNPVFSVNSGNGFYVFKKTEKLEKSLCEFIKNNSNQH